MGMMAMAAPTTAATAGAPADPAAPKVNAGVDEGVDDADAETGHISPRGAISPISHGPSGSTMVKVEPSGAPAAIDANDL